MKLKQQEVMSLNSYIVLKSSLNLRIKFFILTGPKYGMNWNIGSLHGNLWGSKNFWNHSLLHLVCFVWAIMMSSLMVYWLTDTSQEIYMNFVFIMIPTAQYIHTKWYNTSDEFSKLSSLNLDSSLCLNLALTSKLILQRFCFDP